MSLVKSDDQKEMKTITHLSYFYYLEKLRENIRIIS